MCNGLSWAELLVCRQGVDPMYVWLPLTAVTATLPWHSRHAGAHFIDSAVGVPELQVQSCFHYPPAALSHS